MLRDLVKRVTTHKSLRSDLSIESDIPSALPFDTSDVEMQAILHEFLDQAALTAVTGSMVTARAAGQSIRLLDPLSSYIPRKPVAFLACDQSTLMSPCPPAFSTELLRFYDMVGAAASKTPRELTAWAQSNRHADINWQDLKAAWMQACGNARLILLVISELGLLNQTDALTRTFAIEHLVRTVATGATPCIRSDGMVVIPGRLDERRDLRIPLHVSVWAEFNETRHRVLLRDLSLAGVGLGSCPSVRTGTTVMLEMPDGVRLSGKAMWSHGNNVGLQFTDRLTELHPAFRMAIRLRRQSLANQSHVEAN
jgi:uncharacterized membrane protein (DUF441 family)